MIVPLLEQGLAALEITPPPGAVERLDRYAALLLEKNQVMNLTAIRDPEGVARLHMLDCAALVKLQSLEGLRLLDVGTGAGFPGMVLKILVPSLEVTLLDSLQKRLDWLGEVRDQLGLTGLRIVHARAEEAGRQEGFRERFDVVTARAVADMRMLAELCLPCVRVGGSFWAMKSVESDGEIQSARRAIEVLGGAPEPPWDYAIPGTEVIHRVVPVKKVEKTGENFPRTFAKMKKTPL